MEPIWILNTAQKRIPVFYCTQCAHACNVGSIYRLLHCRLLFSFLFLLKDCLIFFPICSKQKHHKYSLIKHVTMWALLIEKNRPRMVALFSENTEELFYPNCPPNVMNTVSGKYIHLKTSNFQYLNVFCLICNCIKKKNNEYFKTKELCFYK